MNFRIILSLCVFMFVAQVTLAKETNGLTEQGKQISFTENKGQVYDQYNHTRPDVLYGIVLGDMAVHVKKSGVSYQLYRIDKYKDVEDRKTKTVRKEIDQQTIHRIDLNWLNANKNFTKTEDEVLPGYTNYYSESCPDGALYVKSFKGITLHNLYKGIDLHYYEKKGELKHDYIVAPHANYKQIQIQVNGADIRLNQDGSLLLITNLGKIQEAAPVVYQNDKQLKAKWHVQHNILSFDIENYNPEYELLIDPITRVWGTYYGGTLNDYGGSTTTDGSGNVYLIGSSYMTTSTIIATSGSHQTAMAGNGDAFLVKFNSNGVRQWGTYYGGADNDGAASCAIDANGNLYMAGGCFTSSSSGIATAGCHQPTHAGNLDAFLVKFDLNGVRQWGTYYGSSGEDRVNMCCVDGSGNVFMTGETASATSTALASAGCHQPAYGGYYYDAFLVKFDASGTRLWGTYYGGTLSDYGYAVSTDTSGNVYMAGSTGSDIGTVIATAGSYQSSFGTGIQDSYLVKFDPNGVRQWGTYYGSPSWASNSYVCSTDANGDVYIAGDASATTGIATPGCYQPVFGGGSYDAYVAKFSAAGSRLWGTYYGGTGMESIWSSSIDGIGHIYFTGSTNSTQTTLATPGAYKPTNGGGYDAFLVKFDVNGSRLYATFFGGSGDDSNISSCYADAFGNVFLSGTANSSNGNIISTPGSHQPTLGGTMDAVLIKFTCNTPVQPSAISGNTIMCSDSGLQTYSIAIVPGASSYTWSLPASWSGSSSINTISTMPGTTGVFTVTASNDCGMSPTQTLSVMVSDCTGLKNIQGDDTFVRVFPNPNQGKATLELNIESSISILNGLGQIVYSARLNAGEHQLNLQNLGKGLYVMKVNNENHSENIKMIID